MTTPKAAAAAADNIKAMHGTPTKKGPQKFKTARIGSHTTSPVRTRHDTS